jgi:hypothetical protein
VNYHLMLWILWKTNGGDIVYRNDLFCCVVLSLLTPIYKFLNGSRKYFLTETEISLWHLEISSLYLNFKHWNLLRLITAFLISTLLIIPYANQLQVIIIYYYREVCKIHKVCFQCALNLKFKDFVRTHFKFCL